MEIRDSIAEHARRRGQSMQEYLLAELEQLTAKPTVEEWLERARERKQRFKSEVTTEQILTAIREGRR